MDDLMSHVIDYDDNDEEDGGEGLRPTLQGKKGKDGADQDEEEPEQYSIEKYFSNGLKVLHTPKIIAEEVEVYLASERNIFSRGSESSIGGGELTVMDPNMPYSIQKLIFSPIRKELESNNIKRIELN